VGELYVVGTAHLDTQWRWTIQKTITDYISATLIDNFALFEKYPDYVFTFEGAFRYQLMKEYYPAEYERLKQYVADGRWRVAGSWLDAVDVNVPSPESLIRHALCGNGYFDREFGKRSRDVYLPDCFGFGYALPSVAAHSGLLGFSTQKLTWGSFIEIPFDLGLWEGVDGSTLVAAINPGEYVGRIKGDLSADSAWVATVTRQGEESGVYKGFKYFGTGDTGGAPTDESVAWLEKSMKSNGPLRVLSVGSDQIMRDLTPAQQAGLPRYKGELLMKRHGVGCYTSQAAMKRWNRRNEILADAAERASVAADWFGAAEYPGAVLEAAWTRFLWHQFHDDLTGTSVPEAYYFSWNDEIISLNQFASVVTDAVGGVSRGLDTRVEGVPLVVYNPLSIEREDVVTAAVEFPQGEGRPDYVRVYGPDKREVPAQGSVDAATGRFEVVFVAKAPPVGFAVYDVRPSNKPCRLKTGLTASAESGVLENKSYRVMLGSDGAIESIYDKHKNRELLSAPLRYQLLDNEPRLWAAWEIDYDDLTATPRSVAASDAPSKIVEQGPARVSYETRLKAESSTIVQRVTLAAGGAGDRIEVELVIDWRSPGTLLKAAFPLAVTSETATYDLRLGVIERGVNRPELYEVPAQRWVDMTEPGDTYGVAVMNDGRYGWDHPDDNTLRLTLVHTPSVNKNWRWIDDQKSQDLGRHRVAIALHGHDGDWRNGVTWQADRFNQPLLAFQVPQHKGKLGRTVVIRLQELAGEPARNVTVEFARDIVSVREVNGAEEPMDATGTMKLAGGKLSVDLDPFRPRAFALELADPPVELTPPIGRPVALPYNLDGVSRDDAPTDGDFDGKGHCIAGDLLPVEFEREGVLFRTGPQSPRAANVMVCAGQELELPDGDHNELYVLAAAVDGGRAAAFAVGGEEQVVWVQDWSQAVGQWDSRLVGGVVYHDAATITPAYINRADVAWVGTHRHGPDGENEPYVYTHFFKYRLDLPKQAETVRLPDDENVRILAMTAARSDNAAARPAMDLYDRPQSAAVEILAEQRGFLDGVEVAMSSPNPHAEVRYTLDGSRPDENSDLYTGPFEVTESAVLKAAAVAPGMTHDAVVAAEFTKLTPRAPAFPADEEPADLAPGLRYDYYEGAWREMPGFAELDVAAADVAAQVAVPAHAAAEDIGVVFEGYLRAPERGIYRLHLWSDDGSMMWLGDEKIIDNDGLHGKTEIYADRPLEAGLHPIRVEFFQHLGGIALELWWEGPGVPLQPVPAEALLHRP
jgi:alpha-mannosidase